MLTRMIKDDLCTMYHQLRAEHTALLARVEALERAMTDKATKASQWQTKAQELKRQGKPMLFIANACGVSRQSVSAYLNRPEVKAALAK